jgi:hypothetical protein
MKILATGVEDTLIVEMTATEAARLAGYPNVYEIARASGKDPFVPGSKLNVDKQWDMLRHTQFILEQRQGLLRYLETLQSKVEGLRLEDVQVPRE